MQLFLASLIEPDKRIKHIYSDIKRLLHKQRVKFYPFDQFFLIYRYLPESETEFLSDINRLIANELKKHRKTTIEIEGVDIYPYKIVPKVLWFRIRENAELRAIAEGLDKELTGFGYAPEDFAFYPHITFARIRKLYNKKLIDIIEEKYTSFEPSSFAINEIIMFESISTPEGAIYRIRNKFQLQ